MRESNVAAIQQALADHDRVTAALKRAVREAILTHAKLGRPVAVWREGKVVWLQPDEILSGAGCEPETHASGHDKPE